MARKRHPKTGTSMVKRTLPPRYVTVGKRKSIYCSKCKKYGYGGEKFVVYRGVWKHVKCPKWVPMDKIVEELPEPAKNPLQEKPGPVKPALRIKKI